MALEELAIQRKFSELFPQHQLRIFEYIVDIILSRPSFHTFLEDSKNAFEISKQEKQKIQEQVNKKNFFKFFYIYR